MNDESGVAQAGALADDEPAESWRMVWRNGFAPEIKTAGLEHLAAALEADDERLLQGATTNPPALMCVSEWPCDGACGLGIAAWGEVLADGFGHPTVGQVENRFADLCYRADQRLGEPSACRHFLNWHDDTPREKMIPALLAEVRRELARRAAEGKAVARE